MERDLSSRSLLTTTRDSATVDRTTPEGGPRPPYGWCLTVVYHPDLSRIGACYRWSSEPGLRVELSRLSPLFASSPGGSGAALADHHLSRSPLLLSNMSDGVLLIPENGRVQYELNGRPGGPREMLPFQVMSRGVMLTLGQRVCLILHGVGPTRPGEVDTGLIGVSDAIQRVRVEIDRLASLDVPVLLTGESGVGKELVARALHRRSARAAKKLIAVNMAALPPSTAAAELFGHARGAFTGAAEARPGLFGEAGGGTLFLDEIGETPAEVQPMLLRAIESHEIQPLGLSPQRIDVRIVAATDSDLEKLTSTGRFRRPLYYRLSAASISMPALRERPVDIPLLIMHFLREALEDFDAGHHLETAGGTRPAWLRKQEMLALLRYPWPGNVRELRNAAYQIALEYHEFPMAQLPSRLMERIVRAEQGWHSTPDRGGSWSSSSSDQGAISWNREPGSRSLSPVISGEHPARARRSEIEPPSKGRSGKAAGPEPMRPSEIEARHLTDALEVNHWRIGATAAYLGISRNSLYALMETFGIRHAGQLSRDDILAAARADGGMDPDRLAERLQVSARGLRLRMRTLGLDS